MISRGGTEYVDVTIAKIAPRNIQRATLLLLTDVDADLRKSHHARDSGDTSGAAEVWRSNVDGGTRPRKCLSTVVRLGEGDGAAVIPNGVDRSVSSNHANKSNQASVVITR